MVRVGSLLALALAITVCSATMGRIFEISARPWVYELSKTHGHVDLSNVPDSELDKLAQDGFTHLYLLGVWSLGAAGLEHDRTDQGLLNGYRSTLPDYTEEDIIGSMFAVTEYVVNPQLGGDSALASLKQRLNARGIKLIVDFVPNHTAVDSPLIKSHPNAYVHSPSTPYDPAYFMPNGIAYGRDKYSGAWYDTAQFNYWNEETVQLRIADLKKAASVADGVRCDMAMLCLNDIINDVWGDINRANGYSRPSIEFWERAINDVKREYPETFFLAELYWGLGGKLVELGFDMVYDKDLLDNLITKDVRNVRGYLTNVDGDFLKHTAHFIENHDEKPFLPAVDNNEDITMAAMAVASFAPGAPFFWMDQDIGAEHRLDVHLRRRTPTQTHQRIYDFYHTKLMPTLDHQIFTEGECSVVADAAGGDAWRVIVYRYSLHSATDGVHSAYVAVNYSGEKAGVNVHLFDAPSSGTLRIKELLTDHEYDEDAAQVAREGMWVILDPWEAQVLSWN